MPEHCNDAVVRLHAEVQGLGETLHSHRQDKKGAFVWQAVIDEGKSDRPC